MYSADCRAIERDRAIWRVKFPNGHVRDAGQFDQEAIRIVFNHAVRAEAARHFGGGRSLVGKIISCLFYEASTRTVGSFESAAKQLGADVQVVRDPKRYSSASKGESLPDTIRSVQGQVNLIVLRHPEDDATERACRVSRVPIINGGSGKLHHPTQALLDAYTIFRELGTLEGLTITFVGDLKHGRTVQSLARLMVLYGARFQFVSPRALAIPDRLRRELRTYGVTFSEGRRLSKKVLSRTDVLYVTRVQKERITDKRQRRKVSGSYRVPIDVYDHLPPQAVIMHPLPRVDELPEELDDHPRSAWFRQMDNGVHIRMALLDLILRR